MKTRPNYKFLQRKIAVHATITTVIVAVVLIVAPATVYATNNDLDPTFDDNGKVTTSMMSDFSDANAIALQPDGKIVAVRSVPTQANTNLDFAVVQYNPDGSLDFTFNNNDSKITTKIDPNDNLNAVALQSDGKIVAAGVIDNETGRDFAMIRLNTNNNLNTTFDTDSKVTTTFGSNTDEATAVLVQTDEKIVVVGQSIVSNVFNFALTRYNTNSSLDTTFDSDGKVTTDIAGSNSQT